MAQAVAGKAIEKGQDISMAKKLLKRELTLLPLFGLIYFTVCGGSFGAEPMVGLSGPGMAFLLMLLVPILFSIPNMLLVREMNSMMPVEGGYYHWLKKAFGPFVGFLGGWMNWVVAWVDVSIYPVWAAQYMGYWIPALREGITIGNFTLDSNWTSWLVALVLIWGVSYLTIRGARLSGLTTNWMGLIMLIPLAIMSVLGIIVWIRGGSNFQMPFLPGGEPVTLAALGPALSTGLFIAMWNFMGWELATVAGDEIVKPKRTYPMAMVLVLIAAIATYAIPTFAGLYGGAGENGQYAVWGQEEANAGEGIGPVLTNDYGIDQPTYESWGVDGTSSVGWEFPDIAHRVADKFTGVQDGPLSWFLGGAVTLSAVLSMIGLFIGNGLGGTRVPFALAEDGMMPKFLVKVHPKYGTPWVSILVCAVIFSIFSINAFQTLVVIDVLLNVLVLFATFIALWVLRFKLKEVKRDKVPGGWVGLTLVTVAPTIVIAIAIYTQAAWEGMTAITWALIAMLIGALIYIPMRLFVKPGIPDVDPFHAAAEE